MRFKGLAAFGVCLCLCGCGIPTLESFILRPNQEITKTPLDWGYPYQAFSLATGEGRSIACWYVPSTESKALLVILQGSDANKSLYTQAIPIFNPDGYDLLLADYEGFGDSPGSKGLYPCLDDADAIVSHALTLHTKVFIYAVSLGTPLATYETAKHPEVRGCMLEACFVVHQEAKLWLLDHWIPLPILWGLANLYIDPQVPEQYDILKYIKDVKQPKLIMHSTEDQVTPFAGGKMVFDAAPEPKEFWQMRGDHGRMVQLEPQAYTAKVTGWLDAHVGD